MSSDQDLLLGDMFGTPEMQRLWTEEATLGRWMEVERALVEVQAEMGMIPREAAQRIIASLHPDQQFIGRMRFHVQQSGHLMVAFLRAFRDTCGAAAEHFHVGPTTQDIMDTGLVLQMREAARIIRRQTTELQELLCVRALAEKATLMMGRTHEQHALPTTFGFVLASWAAEIHDHLDRMSQAEPRWQLGSVAGGVGCQNAFVELLGVSGARALEQRVCEKLQLGRPTICIHGRIDRLAEPVMVLASLCATLGRIGLQLRTMERPEVSEVESVYGEQACSSSTMPNKRNPEPMEVVEGLAKLVKSHASTMLEIRMADHRDSTRTPVLFAAIPGSYLMTARALQAVHAHLSSLTVRRDIMRANVDHPRVLGQAAAERLMIALYRKTGQRHWAHTRLSECARVSRESGRHLREVVLNEQDLALHFTVEELNELFDLSTYTGTAMDQIEVTVRQIRIGSGEHNEEGP